MYLLRQENKIKTPSPRIFFVAVLVGEGGVGHSWRLCVCGWWLCGGDTELGEVQVGRAPWGGHPCCPCTPGSPSVFSLHHGESICAASQSRLHGQKKPGCVTTLPSPPTSGSLAQPAPGPELAPCYPECPCPSQSPRSCKQPTVEKCFPSSPLLAPFPPTSQIGVITEHNYFCM